MKSVVTLAATLLLAGCWQSNLDFYSSTPTATPFRPGRVESRNGRGERGQDLLTQERGHYRLTNNDRADSDFGESFTFRLVALAGLPPDIWVFEAQENCKRDDRNCKAAAQPNYYGLARRTPRGAEVRNPDCPDGGMAGGKSDGYGTCDFSSRATLEKALIALARAPWKPDIVYRYD
jgi:hypothetical protein